MDDLQNAAALNNLVRIGVVSSVDSGKRLARVTFLDKKDASGKPLNSAALKILQNQPLITVEKWVEEIGEENKWDYEAEYNSHDRGLGLGESYVKNDYTALKDVIKNEKVIKYEKRETIDEGSPADCTAPGSVPCCPIEGIIEYKKHRQTVTVFPWLPFVGQYVLCLYLPNGESDGFILGGL